MFPAGSWPQRAARDISKCSNPAAPSLRQHCQPRALQTGPCYSKAETTRAQRPLQGRSRATILESTLRPTTATLARQGNGSHQPSAGTSSPAQPLQRSPRPREQLSLLCPEQPLHRPQRGLSPDPVPAPRTGSTTGTMYGTGKKLPAGLIRSHGDTNAPRGADAPQPGLQPSHTRSSAASLPNATSGTGTAPAWPSLHDAPRATPPVPSSSAHPAWPSPRSRALLGCGGARQPPCTPGSTARRAGRASPTLPGRARAGRGLGKQHKAKSRREPRRLVPGEPEAAGSPMWLSPRPRPCCSP